MAVDPSEVGVQNLRGAIELGQQVLKSLELANGGAVIAILTFYGNAVKGGSEAAIDPVWLTRALGAFATGLVIAILAAAFAYLSQLIAATGEPGEVGTDATKEHADRRKAEHWSIALRAIAIGAAFISLAAFGVGTQRSIHALKPPQANCAVTAVSAIRHDPPKAATILRASGLPEQAQP